MNYLKQLICARFSEGLKCSIKEKGPCITANDNDAVDEINKHAEINETKTNTSDHKTDCKKILDSSLASYNSSEAISHNLANPIDKVPLNDASTEIIDNTIANNKESLIKLGNNTKEGDESNVISFNITNEDVNINCSNDNIYLLHKNNSQEDLIEGGKHAEPFLNANVLSISDGDANVNCLNINNNLLQNNAVGLNSNSINNNEKEDVKEIEDIRMDFDDVTRGTNSSAEQIMIQNEDIYTREQRDEVDINNNNTDDLTQFIENNIVDFVRTPRNISEILSSLIEFDITPYNSFCKLEANVNDPKKCDDDYVLMDLDEIVNEIESIDSYINDKSNSINMEVLNAIKPEDVETILNENLNDYILPPPHLNICADDISKDDVPAENLELQDFEHEIDLISNTNIVLNKKEFPVTSYDFNIEVDVETVSSQHSVNFSEEAESMNTDVDSQSNNFVCNENKSDTTEKILDNGVADSNIEETFVKTTNSKPNETINTETHHKPNNKHEEVKIIDTIVLSSSDDEDNCPLAILKKRKNITVTKTRIALDHISISSDESFKANKDDPDYCSGYESSDFEFISETEAKKSGITIKKLNRVKAIKEPLQKTLEIRSIERINSDQSVKEYFGKHTGFKNYFVTNINAWYIGSNNNNSKPNGLNIVNKPVARDLNKNFYKPGLNGLNKANNPGPSGLNNASKPGPRGLNKNIYKPGPNGLNNVNNPDNNTHPMGLKKNCNNPVPSSLNYKNNQPGLSVLNHNQPGPSGLNNMNNLPGPSGLSNNQQAARGLSNSQPSSSSLYIVNNQPDTSGLSGNQPDPSSGLNNNRNDQLNNKASTEDHVIPEGEEYLNLFQGTFERALRPNPYALENKSIYEPNPKVPGMYIDMHGVGFDMAERQNQPYDEDIDDQTRAEATENRNRILQMYAGENRRKRRR